MMCVMIRNVLLPFLAIIACLEKKKKIAEEAFGEGGCHDDENGSRRGEGGGDDLKMIEMIEIGS